MRKIYSDRQRGKKDLLPKQIYLLSKDSQGKEAREQLLCHFTMSPV